MSAYAQILATYNGQIETLTANFNAEKLALQQSVQSLESAENAAWENYMTQVGYMTGHMNYINNAGVGASLTMRPFEFWVAYGPGSSDQFFGGSFGSWVAGNDDVYNTALQLSNTAKAYNSARNARVDLQNSVNAQIATLTAAYELAVSKISEKIEALENSYNQGIAAGLNDEQSLDVALQTLNNLEAENWLNKLRKLWPVAAIFFFVLAVRYYNLQQSK